MDVRECRDVEGEPGPECSHVAARILHRQDSQDCVYDIRRVNIYLAAKVLPLEEDIEVPPKVRVNAFQA